MADLRKRLDAAIRQQRNLAGAARLNATGIAAANGDAVAMVFVQFADGRVFTGTAFAVRSDPTGGLLVTNKHVVTDSVGNLAVRIGVVFNGTPQNFKADLVRVHPDADLALIRASVHRGFPVVKRLAPAARVGAMGEPVAILGFPLGVDIAQGEDWPQVGRRYTDLGTVSRVLPTSSWTVTAPRAPVAVPFSTEGSVSGSSTQAAGSNGRSFTRPRRVMCRSCWPGSRAP
jgi:hypothetical protein